MESIRVYAPATVANVACGFDIFGFAVNHPGDEVVLTKSATPGIRIKEITGDFALRNQILECLSLKFSDPTEHYSHEFSKIIKK